MPSLSFLFRFLSLSLCLIHVADIKNWTRNTGDAAANGDDNDDVQNFIQTGGFYAYGVNGVFKGVVNILFMFIAFDAMIMSRWAESIWFTKQHTSGGDTKPTNIEHFTKTITQAILSINTAIFLCLLGMAFALTTIQPIQPMASFTHTFELYSVYVKIRVFFLCTVILSKHFFLPFST